MARSSKKESAFLESVEKNRLDTSDPSSLVDKFLRDKRKEHYNFEETVENFIVASGSLMLDSYAQIGPGCHRLIGSSGSGKTSLAFSYMSNFLSNTKVRRRGIYVNSEGRLSTEMKARSRVKFVERAADVKDQWVDGTCFVFETRLFETVATFINDLVEQTSGIQYCFIVDSVDMLISQADVEKSFYESARVAGGAVILSNLFKRISIPLTKRGHMAFFLSQVRSEIKIDPYDSQPKRVIASSGGNTLIHAANYIIEAMPRYSSGDILEDDSKKYDPKTNKIVGHYAKMKLQKTNNEHRNTVVSMPIIHQFRKEGQVWREREVIDMMTSEGMIIRRGSWMNLEDSIYNDIISATGLTFTNNFQGMANLSKFIEDNQVVVDFLYDYFLKFIKLKGCALLKVLTDEDEDDEEIIPELSLTNE